MKICAITMVYRDYWALSQWYAHYGRHLGADNLFVVVHGPDPEIQRICPRASVITIPRDDLERFDRRRGDLLNGIQSGLANIYDWVIRTDVDELICLDPNLHRDFTDMFSKQEANALFALGVDLAEMPEDPCCDPGRSVLTQRSSCVFAPNYSKAWASRGQIGFRRHGVAIRPRRVQHFPVVMPRGAFLVHLKYANIQALSDSLDHRREVANFPGTGMPGTAWKDPEEDCLRFFRKLEKLPETPWPEAEADAYARYSADPLRDTRRGIVRIRGYHPRIRSRLPEWFQNA